MKTASYFIALGLLLSFACNDPEIPELPIPINQNLVRLHEVLNKPLATPEGKLKSLSFYSRPQTLQSRTDYYYDEVGRELLKVRIEDVDTTAIYLNEYLKNGELNRVSAFMAGAEGVFFNFDLQLIYEDEGRTVSVWQGREGEFENYERFMYDELGRKISYRRGGDVYFDLHDYFYKDENDRQIREEHYRQGGMVDPFYRYRYDYDERGLLTARSLQVLSIEFRPAFEYKYDLQGRLIEEITNYLYFGTQPIERKTFDYY